MSPSLPSPLWAVGPSPATESSSARASALAPLPPSLSLSKKGIKPVRRSGPGWRSRLRDRAAWRTKICSEQVRTGYGLPERQPRVSLSRLGQTGGETHFARHTPFQHGVILASLASPSPKRPPPSSRCRRISTTWPGSLHLASYNTTTGTDAGKVSRAASLCIYHISPNDTNKRGPSDAKQVRARRPSAG